MIEVEIKLSVKNDEYLELNLIKNGFLKGDLVEESDIYFNSDIHNFRKTDEALRLRRSDNKTTGVVKNVMTYKGPKIDNISMTRKELETEVLDGDVCKEILCSLGFTQMYPVNKLRQYYFYQNMTACIDHVERLGCFLELEMIVEKDCERKRALQQINNILEKLGYYMEDTTRVSYLSMLQKKEE